MKEFVFPTMVTMKSGETHICSYHSNGYLDKKKCFMENMNLIDMYYHWKIALIE